jgi:hypothetical protein
MALSSFTHRVSEAVCFGLEIELPLRDAGPEPVFNAVPVGLHDLLLDEADGLLRIVAPLDCPEAPAKLLLAPPLPG